MQWLGRRLSKEGWKTVDFTVSQHKSVSSWFGSTKGVLVRAASWLHADPCTSREGGRASLVHSGSILQADGQGIGKTLHEHCRTRSRARHDRYENLPEGSSIMHLPISQSDVAWSSVGRVQHGTLNPNPKPRKGQSLHLSRHCWAAAPFRQFSGSPRVGQKGKEDGTEDGTDSSAAEIKAPTGEWGSWISKRFSEAEKAPGGEAYLGAEPTEAEIQEELQRSMHAAGRVGVTDSSDASDDDEAALARGLRAKQLEGREEGSEDLDDELAAFGRMRGEDEDELDALLDRAEEGEDEDWRGRESSMGWMGEAWEEMGVDFRTRTASELDRLREEGMLSDTALAAIEEFDLEDVERPYQFRQDRLFFPGQTYESEELDLSQPPSQQEPHMPLRTRRTFSTKEALQKADFRNVRFLAQFITETSKILPRQKTKLSAKAQRKVTREIRASRVLGLLPFTTMGQPSFRFMRVESGPSGHSPTRSQWKARQEDGSGKGYMTVSSGYAM